MAVTTAPALVPNPGAGAGAAPTRSAGVAPAESVAVRLTGVGKRSLLRALYAGGTARPTLTVEHREVLEPLADAIRLLGRVPGRSHDDWLGDHGRGEFRARRGGASG